MRALVIVCALVALLPLHREPAAPAKPEQIEQYREGNREFRVRRIAEPSRRVHPAEECYRATGWQIRPLPGEQSGGRRWGCFEAARRGERIQVCETFLDSAGRSWSDAGSWWWSTLFARGHGPWLGVTRVTR